MTTIYKRKLGTISGRPDMVCVLIFIVGGLISQPHCTSKTRHGHTQFIRHVSVCGGNEQRSTP